MSRRTVGLRCALGALGSTLALGLVPNPASAGTYTVANCIADSNYSTDAFVIPELSRGMAVSDRCKPDPGEEAHGLGIGAVARRTAVERGAVAQLAINAPSGTEFTRYGGWEGWTGSIAATNADLGDHAEQGAANPAAEGRESKMPEKGSRTGSEHQEAERALQRERRNANRATGDLRRPARAEPVLIRHTKPDVDAERHARDQDEIAPAVAVTAAPAAWVNGNQSLAYQATDNAGVRSASVLYGSVNVGRFDPSCRLAKRTNEGETFAVQVPCPNGPGTVSVETGLIDEGSRQVVLQAKDPAGNSTDSQPVTLHVDRTAPERVDVSVDGGQGWRNRNDFAAWWINPVEADRAPIASALYQLCPVGGGECVRGEQPGQDLARFGVPVPQPGEWKLSIWRRDAAMNVDERFASVPVILRYDPDPPQLGFETPSASDPTPVSVKTADAVSRCRRGFDRDGLAGSGLWRTLPVGREGDHLIARLDDAARLPVATSSAPAPQTEQATRPQPHSGWTVSPWCSTFPYESSPASRTRSSASAWCAAGAAGRVAW